MAETEPLYGHRIWVLGSPGSGKTTLARLLRDMLCLPYYELDQFFWRPGWRKANEADFLDSVARAVETDGWIFDGQYNVAHPLLGETADTVVWLDPPLHILVIRVLLRSVRGLLHGAEICNGNREHPVQILNLMIWTIRTHRGTRRCNLALQHELSARGVRCARVRTRAHYRALLDGVPQ